MTGGAAALKLEEGRAALRYRAFKLVRGKFARLARCRIHRIDAPSAEVRRRRR